MSAEPTLRSLDERVGELEEWRGAVIKRMTENGASLDKLALVVGSPPTDDSKGTGMAADVAVLKETVGEEPSEIRGTTGSGMARMVFDVHKLVMERKGFWPGVVDKTKSVTVVLAFIVACATVLSGCAAVATYLIRVAVANSSQIAHPAPKP